MTKSPKTALTEAHGESNPNSRKRPNPKRMLRRTPRRMNRSKLNRTSRSTRLGCPFLPNSWLIFGLIQRTSASFCPVRRPPFARLERKRLTSLSFLFPGAVRRSAITAKVKKAKLSIDFRIFSANASICAALSIRLSSQPQPQRQMAMPQFPLEVPRRRRTTFRNGTFPIRRSESRRILLVMYLSENAR